MPKHADLKKVLVIGSGPIIIGQAAEFDYAGTQACKALKEEGLEVVLVNSNPATIMTDNNMADHVYIEPLTKESLARIIAKERPDGLIPGLGGQTGLNLAVELAEAGILDRYGVKLLGTSAEAIRRSEDREMFKKTMQEIGEPIPDSVIITSIEEAFSFVEKVGYPIIVRPAYTLGGTGGGIAHNETELRRIVDIGLKASRIGQVLLEQSVLGWKEIEFEVMRDAADNCITICSMENVDPMGVHTGDSIVVAPTQTLNMTEFEMLRQAALKIIRALRVEGGCNIQFALHPTSLDYVVIEVNPRVSRSSALASKATGYPIARVTTKIAVGLTLDEINNPVTGKTSACFEPAIDYIVVKVPRWPFDKFTLADRSLGTQMKATGEVMAIDRTFEAALLKAVRSLEIGVYGLRLPEAPWWTDMELEHKLANPTDERLFAIAEAFRRGWEVQEVANLTRIDKFFLVKIQQLVEWETRLTEETLTRERLWEAKRLGFSDYQIAKLRSVEAETIRRLRKEHGLIPVYKMVDTCAAEFEAVTPYYYSTYEQEDEVTVGPKPKVLVLGSGPIRIGQGIEFDYCSVHSVWALREAGYESIIINNNPETVSTDFDTSDKLYFEPLALEDVLNLVDRENPLGVVVQFGGQTAINLASGLAEHGVTILGTSVEAIDMAEDRRRCEQVLRQLGIPQSQGRTATRVEEVVAIANELGFPVLVRPSYVLGGRAMEVVENLTDLTRYMESAVQVSPKHPILIDKYIRGREVEVDAISDGERVLIPGIIEHIERAGVHSGDSMAVFPAQNLSPNVRDKIVEYTTRIARAMEVRGLVNIQFVVTDEEVYVLEVNPRASRTVPIVSKSTGIPMVKVATKVMLGLSLADQGYAGGLWPQPHHVVVKAPVFSFEKLSQVEISLGPEMKSTGEVMGIDYDFSCALYKAMVSAGIKVPPTGTILVSVADRDKAEAVPVVREFASLGFRVLATDETARELERHGLSVEPISLNGQGLAQITDLIRRGQIQLVINTPTRGKIPERGGFKIRRLAAEYRLPCLTSLDTAQALLQAIRSLHSGRRATCLSMQEYLQAEQTKGLNSTGDQFTWEQRQERVG
ncbi:MAG: carbamoyl-phosphate synthase large subunit [Firmicutes bacterium]|nr:carbamoyl-phosphate synthase large subunit [Bacillota bacterium]